MKHSCLAPWLSLLQRLDCSRGAAHEAVEDDVEADQEVYLDPNGLGHPLELGSLNGAV